MRVLERAVEAGRQEVDGANTYPMVPYAPAILQQGSRRFSEESLIRHIHPFEVFFVR